MSVTPYDHTSRWYDVGHQADVWGREIDEPTCIGNNTVIPTRRDYAIVNAQAFELITDFEVSWDNDFPTHAALHLTLATDFVGEEECRVSKPEALHEAVEKHLRAKHRLLAGKPVPREIDDKFTQALSTDMDAIIALESDKFQDLLRRDDMTEFWIHLSQTMEHVIVDEFRLSVDKEKLFQRPR